MDKRKPARLHEYRLAGDWTCLVGRTERDNDQLSIKIARPQDWWFHVRGHPGSHVVLRVADREPDRDTRERAAAIAAWHSRLRNGGRVAVSCTRARFVTKPRGAKPGSVQIRREEVLQVRPSIEGAELLAPPDND